MLVLESETGVAAHLWIDDVRRPVAVQRIGEGGRGKARPLTYDAADVPAECGGRMTLGKASNGFASSGGSSSKTSMPAPAIQPDSRARSRARSSTSPPRAVFSRYAVGRMERNSGSPSR